MEPTKERKYFQTINFTFLVQNSILLGIGVKIN